MNPKYTDINYLNLDAEQKDFVQRMVFLDFIEEIEQCQFKGEDCMQLYSQLEWELAHYEWNEDYETCKLIQDILIRFETDILQFDN